METACHQESMDDAVLALLFANSFSDGFSMRSWKSLPWESMERLHEKGYIGDPKSKARSVILTEEGQEAAQTKFVELFGA